VAARADSLARFGRELADWLHTVRTLGSRPALARTLETAPRRLSGVFPEGALADATLAAYAEWLSACIRNTPPDFKRRNLFTSVPDLPVRLRRGRPPVPAVTKRATNAAVFFHAGRLAGAKDRRIAGRPALCSPANGDTLRPRTYRRRPDAKTHPVDRHPRRKIRRSPPALRGRGGQQRYGAPGCVGVSSLLVA
jgi:hypothetical protein